VAQIGDGVVGLPADARTVEQLEWVAEDITQARGTAMLWTARAASVEQERWLAGQMAHARAVEYVQVRDHAVDAFVGDEAAVGAVLRRVRAELRRIERRDFFPPPERDAARAAVCELAARVGTADRERA
jgi:hypothetical protein